MDEKEFASIKGWFTGRLPDGWFTGVEITIEDDQVVVLGTLPDMGLPPGATPEEKEGAAAGRIARFREATRTERITIAQEVEERFRKYVTWGARLDGVTKRFTPGGGGGGGGRVMIGRRWWPRRRRGWPRPGSGEESAQTEPQVF